VPIFFIMAAALIISLAIFSCAAIPLSSVLIYHDINSKANSSSWERALAVMLEIVQISMLVAGTYATAVTLHSGSRVYWYDAAVLGSLQLSVGNNVWPLLLFGLR
jgi:hypothetical protein